MELAGALTEGFSQLAKRDGRRPLELLANWPGPRNQGRVEWTHLAPHAKSLCVDRQFRAGQCFLANGSGKPTDFYLSRGHDCATDWMPKGYDFVMQIDTVVPRGKSGQCDNHSVAALNDTVALCVKVAGEASGPDQSVRTRSGSCSGCAGRSGIPS